MSLLDRVVDILPLVGRPRALPSSPLWGVRLGRLFAPELLVVSSLMPLPGVIGTMLGSLQVSTCRVLHWLCSLTTAPCGTGVCHLTLTPVVRCLGKGRVSVCHLTITLMVMCPGKGVRTDNHTSEGSLPCISGGTLCVNRSLSLATLLSGTRVRALISPSWGERAVAWPLS
jgi:hypothetical protein